MPTPQQLQDQASAFIALGYLASWQYDQASAWDRVAETGEFKPEWKGQAPRYWRFRTFGMTTLTLNHNEAALFLAGLATGAQGRRRSTPNLDHIEAVAQATGVMR